MKLKFQNKIALIVIYLASLFLYILRSNLANSNLQAKIRMFKKLNTLSGLNIPNNLNEYSSTLVTVYFMILITYYFLFYLFDIKCSKKIEVIVPTIAIIIGLIGLHQWYEFDIFGSMLIFSS